jgi:hypothetical protein
MAVIAFPIFRSREAITCNKIEYHLFGIEQEVNDFLRIINELNDFSIGMILILQIGNYSG